MFTSLSLNRPEHTFAEQIVGPDGLPPPMFAQPMLYWLANIISSRAFADFNDVAQLLALKPPQDSNFRILAWADDAKERPVFPEWTSGGPKEKTKSPTSWASQFANWGRRTGFTAPLGLHSVRREALIKVNGKQTWLGLTRYHARDSRFDRQWVHTWPSVAFCLSEQHKRSGK